MLPSSAEVIIKGDRYSNLLLNSREDIRNITQGNLPGLNPAAFTEGCIGKAILSGVGGSVMGALMGGFFHTLAPQDYEELEKKGLSFRQQVKESFRGLGQSSYRMSSAFGKIGILYAATECLIERERGAHDKCNAAYAGCVTGFLLGIPRGPTAGVTGCLGFGIFSVGIEAFMDR